MITEALRWYAESLSAFWVSFAGGGLPRLIVMACLIYWIFCKRGRGCCHGGRRGCGCRCRCSHCGCRCGRCPCGEGDHDDGHEDAEDATE
jgi:hypothetical protein